jgi:hypothetical protein
MPNLITDTAGKPAPQYLDRTETQYEASTGSNGGIDVNVAGPIPTEPFSGTTNDVHVFSKTMYGFGITNDGESDLTFQPNGLDEYTLKPGEVWEYPLFPFLSVIITTTSAYRAWGLI